MSIHRELYKYYTGIGSRETPSSILDEMTHIAKILNQKDYILRSGGAMGADTAFKNGAGIKCKIYVPWNNYNNLEYKYPIPNEAFIIAVKLHPVWVKLTDGAKKLMARNTMQILGENLDDKSYFVICWTKDGAKEFKEVTSRTGGTGLAIKLARENNIPVYNLKNDSCRDNLHNFLRIL